MTSQGFCARGKMRTSRQDHSSGVLCIVAYVISFKTFFWHTHSRRDQRTLLHWNRTVAYQAEIPYRLSTSKDLAAGFRCDRCRDHIVQPSEINHIQRFIFMSNKFILCYDYRNVVYSRILEIFHLPYSAAEGVHNGKLFRRYPA